MEKQIEPKIDARWGTLQGVPVIESTNYFSPYYKYNPPVEGKIAIIASTPYLGYDAPTGASLEKIKQCGFNVFNAFPSYDAIRRTLDLAEKYDLKVLLYHSHLFNSSPDSDTSSADILCRDLVKNYKNHKALGGWSMPDQPTYDQLKVTDKPIEGTDETTNPRCLQHFYNIIKEEDPNHLIHINLVGSAVSKYMNGKTYNDYMDIFQINFLPGLWSYDMYPMYIEKGRVGVAYWQFYRDFELYSLRQRMLNRPFWAYCQSQGFKNSTVERPNPTETYLRFEAFSALGYGAQGIVYWTYHQRENTSNEEYISAPIDINGNETPIWGYVKQVNAEIAAYNDVFYDCQLIECLHTINFAITGEDTLIPDGTCNLDNKTTFGPFSKIEREEGGLGFQISHLSTNGIDYMVFVNHDIEYDQEITLTSPDYNTILKLNLDSEFNLIEESVSGTNTYTVPAGGYMIFKWY